MSEYRLNYGNGQVSETFSTLKAARGAFAAQVRFDRDCRASSGSLRIERYEGDGEWVTVRRDLHPIE